MEKLMTKNVLKKFVAVAACVGFPLFIVTSANAQTTPTPAPAAGEATTERVIVTGSNIPTTETEAALPVTVYSAEVLQKNGANTPAEGLRQLPSYVGNTFTENDSNGGNGAASVTLRGLGPANTLTLINGRRTNIFSNINAIPVGALSRAEILKDGASSVYGSDAVAGVVNFILLNGGGDFFNGDPPYEGAEVFLLYGNTSTDDARVLQGYMRGGVTALDGKVAIAAAGEYYNRLDIFSRDRNVSASADTRHLGGANNASPTYAGRAQYRTSGTETVQATLIDLTTVNPNNTTPGNPGATYRVFDAAAPNTDPDRFNFRAFTPAIPGQEKAEYYVTGRLKIFDDMLQMYGDILYAKTKQNNGLAAAPFALSRTDLIQNSPFSPFDETTGQLRATRYRLVNDLGPRRSLFDDDYYRYTIGFAGEFNMTNNQFISNWGYDSGFVYERQQEIRVDSGDAKRSAIVAAIAGFDPNGNFTGVYFDPFIGQNAPTSGTANTYTSAGVFAGTHTYDNKATATAASYIGHSIFKERDFAYDAKANGNFFPELWNGGVGASIGYEHRHSGQESIPDPVQVAGDQLGFNQSPLDKFVQEVDSFFGEVRLPLITSTQNISWMRSLELDFAYRYEEFEDRNQDPFFIAGVPFTKGKFNNGGDPRISIRIQPIEDVILRGSWGKSFRSPAPINLFNPPFQNFPQLFDPAIHGSGTFQPAQGVNEVGNPNLKPEETDSYAAGIVYTPAWVRNMTGGTLTLSVDFYQEFTNQLILNPNDEAQVLLIQSAPGGVGITTDPDGPGLGVPGLGGGGPALGVTRNNDGPGGIPGTVSAIDSAFFNAGKRLVNGMDVNAVYQLPTSNWGTYTWTAGYNYFFTWKASVGPGANLHSFLGDYNNGTLPLAPGAIPYHKGFLRFEWEGTTGWMRGFDFVAAGNYISSFNDDSAFLIALPGVPKPVITNGNPLDPTYSRYRRVTDYITLDMQLSYEFKKPVTEAAVASYSKDSKDGKNAMAPVGGADNGTFAQRMLWNTKFTVGVNNAFDREPPSVLGAFNDTYDTSLYSIRDRFYYISLAKKF
jgi:iron complex outermembrane receptor protein